MTLSTSQEAYAKVCETGLVKKLHKEIVVAMLRETHSVLQKSLTTSEIAAALGIVRDLVSPRMTELEALGVVKRWDRRACRITGYSCGTWTLTGKPPVVPPKKHFMKCSNCDGKGKIQLFSGE